MNVTYRIFDAWKELDGRSESKDFMCYQTFTGKIIALNYSDMRRLFLRKSKRQILEANAILLSGLEQALNTNSYSGSINI